jgi:hypothetical protein
VINKIKTFEKENVIKNYTFNEFKNLIIDTLQNDPRSKSKKKNNIMKYGFQIDNINILCEINQTEKKIQIIDIEDWTLQ